MPLLTCLIIIPTSRAELMSLLLQYQLQGRMTPEMAGHGMRSERLYLVLTNSDSRSKRILVRVLGKVIIIAYHL